MSKTPSSIILKNKGNKQKICTIKNSNQNYYSTIINQINTTLSPPSHQRNSLNNNTEKNLSKRKKNNNKIKSKGTIKTNNYPKRNLNKKPKISFIEQNNYDNNNITESHKKELEKINQNIFILERSLPELTRDYKNLVTKLNTNLFPGDNANLRNNMQILEVEIETNKKKLFELKQTRQEILKNNIS